MNANIARLIDQMLESKAYPSFNSIALDMGVKQPTLHRIYTGESKAPERRTLERIAKFFYCSVEDLYRGNVIPPSSNSRPSRNSSEPSRLIASDEMGSYDARPGTVEIPQYDVAGAMGDDGLMLADQPGVITDWHVTPEWLTKNVPHCTGARNLCIVTGFGDSMRPLYNPGDPLLVDIGVRKIEADAVYFFRVGGEGYIKRIQRIPGRGYLVKSANPEYETWTITPDMDVQVLGRVLMAWRSEKF